MNKNSSCLWKLQKAKTLQELALRFVKAKPYDENTWILMANCYSLNEDRPSALKFLSRAIHLNPSHSYAHCLIGQELFFMDELDRATEHFKKATLLNSRQFFAWCGLGSVSLKRDKFRSALDFFNKAQYLNPRCPIVYSYIGICNLNLGRFEMSLQNFEKAESLDKKNAMNRYQKANALYKLNRYNAALYELEQLKRDSSRDEPMIYILFGRVLDIVGGNIY